MDDAHPGALVSGSDSSAALTPETTSVFPQSLPHSLEEAYALSENVALYSHTVPEASVLARQLAHRSVSLCHSFEDLLLLLEVDEVDVIVFANDVGLQERSYVMRWAQIFKPSVRCRSYEEFSAQGPGLGSQRQQPAKATFVA